jgi:hypothetical protein
LQDDSHNGDDAMQPMERFEDLAKRLFRVAKGDVEKAEREAKELIDDTLGPPPAQGPAVSDEGD